MNAAQNVANSILNNVRFSALCLAWCRGDTGTSRALQAFRLHANDIAVPSIRSLRDGDEQ